MDRCIRDDVLTNKAIVYVNINVILVTELDSQKFYLDPGLDLSRQG